MKVAQSGTTIMTLIADGLGFWVGLWALSAALQTAKVELFHTSN